MSRVVSGLAVRPLPPCVGGTGRGGALSFISPSPTAPPPLAGGGRGEGEHCLLSPSPPAPLPQGERGGTVRSPFEELCHVANRKTQSLLRQQPYVEQSVVRGTERLLYP